MKRMMLSAAWCVTFFAVCLPVDAANQVLKLIGDSESFFEVPDDDSLDADLEEFTVEAWVNPSDWHGEDIVVNKEDAYEFAVVEGSFDTAVQPLGQGWEWHVSGEEVPIGEWTHLAITWDGDLINMYFNGEWAAEGFKPGDAVNDSPDTLKVGRRTRGDETHSSFEGFVDEVRISNIVRYTDDGFVPATTAFVPDEHTVALYHFDDHDNGVVRDASGLGNHGELLGDAVLVADDFLSSGQSGDYNGDGTVDVKDIDLQATAMGGNDPNFDENGDGMVDGDDRAIWIEQHAGTWIGDANLDGEFNSGDLVAVFTAGKYESGANAGWGEGDWDGDKIFGSGDLVAAFTEGGYEQGPRDMAAAVPEPAGIVLVALAIIAVPVRLRRGVSR